jgi:hypothetical protein
MWPSLKAIFQISKDRRSKTSIQKLQFSDAKLVGPDGTSEKS